MLQRILNYIEVHSFADSRDYVRNAFDCLHFEDEEIEIIAAALGRKYVEEDRKRRMK